MIEAVEALKNSGKVTVDEEHDWGYQLRFVNEDEYCGKLLVIDNGKSGSLHYHEVKKETFIHLYGDPVIVYSDIKAMSIPKDKLEYENETVLFPGDRITLEPFVQHKMRIWSSSFPFCSVILEVSTHDDDDDTYRIGGEADDE